MTIGVALFLLAAGAILRFAVASVSTHGIDLHTVGDILMIVGALGLVLWVFIWAPWARNRRAAYRQRPPLDDESRTYDVYRTEHHYDDLPPR
jgi:Domain of unknown function (DUF6458)